MATQEFWIRVAVFTVAFVVPFGIVALILYAGRRLRRRTPAAVGYPRLVSTRLTRAAVAPLAGGSSIAAARS
jgi:hypothetical protein